MAAKLQEIFGGIKKLSAMDKKKILKNKDLVGFKVANAEKRMNDPTLPLEFTKVEGSGSKGIDYFGVSNNNGGYDIVPRSVYTGVYEHSIHGAAGGEKLFKSNFKAGDRWNFEQTSNIIPAQISADGKILKQGSMEFGEGMSGKPLFAKESSAGSSPVANKPTPRHDGGGGSEAPKASGQQAAEEVQKQAGQTVPAKGGAPAEEGFSNTGAGSDKDPMEDFFSGKLGQDGLSNADKHKFNRVRDDYRNYNALKGELEEWDADGLAKLNKEYGIGKDIDPAEHFKQQANGEATTMDWIMGNHVPEIGLGTAMAGGAISACFSNKGKMSNSQLYGESF